MSEAMTVTLHSVETGPRAGRRHVYLYTVTDQDGHELLTRSADPACDLARELLSRGITGKVRVVEERGVHRYTVDIEKGREADRGGRS